MFNFDLFIFNSRIVHHKHEFLCLKLCREGLKSVINIENRIYREELKESLGMNFVSNFVSPFQPEREFKVYKSAKVHKLYAVECINTVCSLDYSFQFRIF